MSDMIINDSVPVDKKWSELIRYNIFIMKLVEFVISLLITLLPMAIPKPQGHMYCISTGPTLIISFLFIILYLRKKVPLFMEKMYLFFQILFTFGAFVQCFLLNLVMSMLLMIIPFVLGDAGIMHCLAVAPTLVMSIMFVVLYLVDQVHNLAEQLYLLLQIILNVVALLLNIIPHIVDPVDFWHCLVAGPTLMVSLYIMVLYIVDQAQYEAEFYYLFIELTLTIVALVNLFIVGKIVGAIYGLFYIDLIIAFCMDGYYMHKERGFTL